MQASPRTRRLAGTPTTMAMADEKHTEYVKRPFSKRLSPDTLRWCARRVDEMGLKDVGAWLRRTADEHDESEPKRAVRVEMVEFDDGERGCRFIVGKDHVVAEWRGDGIAGDTVFVEDTALTYFETTTLLDRCVRMVLEMCHWEVVSAMLVGPGDGELVAWAERYGQRVSGELKLCPFCGGTATMESGPRFEHDPECEGPDSKWYAVKCRSCAAQGPWAKSESGATRWWNMRVGEGEDDE